MDLIHFQGAVYPKDLPIWRYMSFAEFCSLVSTKSLFFSHPSELDDATEGVYSNPSEEAIIAFADRMFEETENVSVSREVYRKILS